MSPAARTLEALRAMGYTAEVVERFIPGARIRVDLGGFADVLAWHPIEGILAVQSTSGDHVAHRLAKAKAEPRLAAWLEAGGRFAVHGWRLAGARGTPKRWTCRIEPIGLAELGIEARRCPRIDDRRAAEAGSAYRLGG